MHNGFEPPTGGSKFGEHREQQIWEKQSGGLFRSDCAIFGIPSSVPKSRRTLLRFTAFYYVLSCRDSNTSVQILSKAKKFGRKVQWTFQYWVTSPSSVPITGRHRRLWHLRPSVQILLRQYRPGAGARQPAPPQPQLAVFAGRQPVRQHGTPSRPNQLAGSPAAPGILKEEAVWNIKF